VAINLQLVKEKPFTGIGDDQVPHNDAGTVITQIVFSDTEKTKQVNACFVGNPHNGVVAQMAPVVEVTDLNLQLIVKLVGRLLVKFDGWHAQVLQQLPPEGQVAPLIFLPKYR
jgi:hypothetical protein